MGLSESHHLPQPQTFLFISIMELQLSTDSDLLNEYTNPIAVSKVVASSNLGSSINPKLVLMDIEHNSFEHLAISRAISVYNELFHSGLINSCTSNTFSLVCTSLNFDHHLTSFPNLFPAFSLFCSINSTSKTK